MLTRLCLSVPRDPRHFEEGETQGGQPRKYPELVGMNLGKPVAYNKDPIPRDELPVIFAGHMWYVHHGRFLTRDEVVGMQDYMHNSKTDIDHSVFNRFEDPNDLMTIELQKLRPKHGESLWGQVHTLINKARESNAELKKIEEAFDGLYVRT